MKYILISLLIIGMIYFIYKASIKMKDKIEARKVIKLSLNRGNKKFAFKQKCSLCHKKSTWLTFYANEYGKAIGVCEKCKPIAERRALLKL